MANRYNYLDLDPTYEIVLYHLVNQTLAAGDLAGARAIQLRIIEANTAITARFGVAGERRVGRIGIWVAVALVLLFLLCFGGYLLWRRRRANRRSHRQVL